MMVYSELQIFINVNLYDIPLSIQDAPIQTREISFMCGIVETTYI